MASTYSTSLRLELMGTGDQSGTWGATTNINLGTLIEQAITGVVSKAQGDVANLTLTALHGGTDEARNVVLNFTGALTAARNVIVPTAEKVYLVKNSTSGGFALTIKTSAGTGVLLSAGVAQWVYCDGTNVVSGLAGPLSDIQNLAVTNSNFIVGNGTSWVAESGATARASLSLGNVDNTSDAAKPVSTATQTALDAKLALAGGTMTGLLGQGNVGVDIGTADNISTRINSGYYQTVNGTLAEGWPLDSGSWQYVVSCTHSDQNLYYAMQLASSFTQQTWYIRNTNNSGSQAWSKIWTDTNDGAGSGLDADLLDGYQSSVGATGNTIPIRGGTGDLYMVMGYSTYLNMSHPPATNNSDTVFYSSTDNYLRKNTAAGFKASLGISGYVKISDVKASGTNGGSSVGGATWQTRTLNSENSDTQNLASLASNQVTLAAGTYQFRGTAPFYGVNTNMVRLYNATDSTVVAYGFSNTTPPGHYQRGEVVGTFTITTPKAFTLQYRCQTSIATNGLGALTAYGVSETYAVLEFWRV